LHGIRSVSGFEKELSLFIWKLLRNASKGWAKETDKTNETDKRNTIFRLK